MDNILRFIDFDFKHRWQSILRDVVTLSVFGLTLLWVVEYIKTLISIPEFITYSPEPIRVAAFFLWLLLGFGLWKLGWQKYQEHKSLIKDKTYTFKHSHWPSSWIFNGKTETTARIDELYVKSSRAGCLLKTHVWKDFRMTFELKFMEHLMKYVGIVFRAEDLENYLMLELFREDGGSSEGKPQWKSGIKPHIRYKGGWEMVYREIYNELDFTDFTQVILEVKDDTVNLFYKGEPKFIWILPTHVDVNHIETGSRKQDEEEGKGEKIGKDVARNVQEIPFRLAYGRVGFRAHPGQGAIIKDLKVEPL